MQVDTYNSCAIFEDPICVGAIRHVSHAPWIVATDCKISVFLRRYNQETNTEYQERLVEYLSYFDGFEKEIEDAVTNNDFRTGLSFFEYLEKLSVLKKEVDIILKNKEVIHQRLAEEKARHFDEEKPAQLVLYVPLVSEHEKAQKTSQERLNAKEKEAEENRRKNRETYTNCLAAVVTEAEKRAKKRMSSWIDPLSAYIRAKQRQRGREEQERQRKIEEDEKHQQEREIENQRRYYVPVQHVYRR